MKLKIRLTEASYNKQKIEMAVKQKELEEMTERCQKEKAEKMEFKNAWERSEEMVAKMEEDRKQCNKATVPIQELSRMFSPGQIRMIKDPTLKKVHWSEEDYATAMSARSYGHAAYEYWRCTRNIPMPAPSTLRKKAATINFEPGVLLSVFNHMRLKSTTMGPRERLCVASFDEVYNSQQIDIDKKHELVVNFLILSDSEHSLIFGNSILGWATQMYAGFDVTGAFWSLEATCLL